MGKKTIAYLLFVATLMSALPMDVVAVSSTEQTATSSTTIDGDTTLTSSFSEANSSDSTVSTEEKSNIEETCRSFPAKIKESVGHVYASKEDISNQHPAEKLQLDVTKEYTILSAANIDGIMYYKFIFENVEYWTTEENLLPNLSSIKEVTSIHLSAEITEKEFGIFTQNPNRTIDAEKIEQDNSWLNKKIDLEKEEKSENGQIYYLFKIEKKEYWIESKALTLLINDKELESSSSTEEVSSTESIEQSSNRENRSGTSDQIVSQWGTNYNLRITVSGHGMFDIPYKLEGCKMLDNTTNNMNKAVTVEWAVLMSSGVTFYRYKLNGQTYWTDSRAFSAASEDYIVSQWGTNYTLKFGVGGHGILSLPYKLKGVEMRGNTSNHLGKIIKAEWAVLMSNGVTFYRYQMDGNVYWTDSRAFVAQDADYIVSQWGTNYTLKFGVGGHGILSLPYKLEGVQMRGNTSNHLGKIIKAEWAVLMSNGVTFYRYQMDGNVYWTDSKAFIAQNEDYIVSQWGTNYTVRIANGGHGLHDKAYRLPGVLSYGNTSSYIGRRVYIEWAVLMSNGDTYYRYKLDGQTYWTNSKAFGNRVAPTTVVNTASKYIGVASNPIGSRNNMFNTAYFGHPVSGNSQYDWCATFVWYVFREVGIPSEYYGGGKTTLPSALETWFRSKGRWTTTPQVGDMAFYTWNGISNQHVGLIKSIRSDGSMVVLDGNYGDKVVERIVWKNDITLLGYGRPEY